jgi:hypothetical protein
MAEEFDIFLSYQNSDHEWANGLVRALAGKNLRVWHEATEIEAGDSFIEDIEEGLHNSAYFVVVITPESVGSNWIAAELGAALAMKKPLIPIVSKDTRPELLPGPIRRRKWLAMEDPDVVAEEIAKRVSVNTNRFRSGKDESTLCAAN